MSRKQSRESAMKLLFEINYRMDEMEEVLDNFLNENEIGDNESAYLSGVVRGTLKHMDEIDGMIEKYSKGWKIGRMGKIDLTILRLAAYELHFTSLPTGIVINEAVELAKKYGSDSSGPFVNGILASISKERQETL